MNLNQKSLQLHKKYRGKIEIANKIKVSDKKMLSLAYTPGVAEACRKIAKNKKDVDIYTNRKSQIAVVTDGSAVLGLGNIGPEAALPVMEGKCLLFKEFGKIDAFPICLNTQDTEEIIKAVKNIAPVFSGINLEDISAPRCFEIEERLAKELDIPVFHDDQHGTAIVVLAGLINASRALKKDIKKLKVIINGAGAAGMAIFNLLKFYGVKEINLVDSQGSIYLCRPGLNQTKIEAAKKINFFCKEGDSFSPKNRACQSCRRGNLESAISGKDVFIGVSKPNLLTPKMIKNMNEKPIIFAMANPIPEIDPDKAERSGASIVATGRSNYPNQVNNLLVFPGIFRAALDLGIKKFSNKIKIAATHAIAYSVKNPTSKNIIPSPFDKNVVKNIAREIKKVI